VTGVVGPDGQMGSTGLTGAGASTYVKKSGTSDNAVDSVVERREAAPGGVQSLHIGVVLDQAAAASTNPAEIQKMIASAVGIDPRRGDTVRVSVLPFDRTAEKSAAAELAAATAANAKTQQWAMYRNIGIAVAVLGGLLLLWLRGRKKSQARQEATTYVVEQLRRDAATRAVELDPPTAMLSLESIERSEQEAMRLELNQLVENQPEDVAALLRGWLVER
jgi:flagellar M-ring protein FliF